MRVLYDLEDRIKFDGRNGRNGVCCIQYWPGLLTLEQIPAYHKDVYTYTDLLSVGVSYP